MGFALRKVAATVLMPLPVALGLCLLGVLLWQRRPRRGAGLLGAGLLLLWAASCMPLARAAVGPLESAYPPFPGDSVAAVVVLGGGHTSAPDLPVTALPEPPSLYRIAEGVRLARAQPWATLVVSAYGGADARSHADVARELAEALGIGPDRIHAEPRPRDTAQEAELLAPVLEGRPFALVTSATHMPRAVAIFRARGLEPVPAPTGHLAKGRSSFGWRDLVPRTDALHLSRAAWYELLARIWAELRGWA